MPNGAAGLLPRFAPKLCPWGDTLPYRPAQGPTRRRWELFRRDHPRCEGLTATGLKPSSASSRPNPLTVSVVTRWSLCPL